MGEQADQGEFDLFWRRLRWRPITAYDRKGGALVLLRAGERWAFGSWGYPLLRANDLGSSAPDSEPWAAAWRDAQESLEGERLSFEPDEFAEVGDEWRVHLMAD